MSLAIRARLAQSWVLPFRRQLHSTTPALKKQSSRGTNDDLFAGFEDASDVDLFSTSRPSKKQKPVASIENASSSDTVDLSGRLSNDLEWNFTHNYTFISDRIGTKPVAKHPQVRSTALASLLHHTHDKNRLEKVIDLLPAWRNSGRNVPQSTVYMLIDRCISYHPPFLVKLFSERPTYGIDLPSLPIARRILHTLVTYDLKALKVPNPSDPETHEDGSTESNSSNTALENLKNATAFAALYPVFHLPPASTDATSLALLARACAQVRVETNSSDPESEGDASAHSYLVGIVPDLAKRLRTVSSKPPSGFPYLKTTAQSGKMIEDRSVLERRSAGWTQSALMEWKWVTASLRVVRAALRRAEIKSPSSQFIDEHLQKRIEGAKVVA